MMRHKNPQTKQNSIIKSLETGSQSAGKTYDIGQVLTVYSDRLTCDINTLEGRRLTNVPVKTQVGLVDEKVFGEIDLPAIGTYVSLELLGGRPVIAGVLAPYIHKLFSVSDHEVAGPDVVKKEFTQKLFEEDQPRTYKKIFQSGSSMEFNQDGSGYIEMIDGSRVIFKVGTDAYVEFKSELTASDEYCRILMKSTTEGILVEDTVNGNTITINSVGVEIEDLHGNTYIMDSSGITLEDLNGNIISMEAGKVDINNGNCEVLQ